MKEESWRTRSSQCPARHRHRSPGNRGKRTTLTENGTEKVEKALAQERGRQRVLDLVPRLGFVEWKEVQLNQ